MISNLTKHAMRSGVAAIAATMLALALMPSGAAAGPCPSAILKCGCTIGSPGAYTLSGPNPMLLDPTNSKTCVDIETSRVTLTGGPALKGPGSATMTVGVHIAQKANRVTLQSVEATNFGQGMLIEGPNATVREGITSFNNKGTVVTGDHALLVGQSSNRDGFAGIEIDETANNFVMTSGTANEATGAGILLYGVKGAVLSSVVAKDNVTYGIWLRRASNNLISAFDTEDNGTAGVYLGCNPAGPNAQPCPISSDGNTISVGIVSNMGILLHQSYGIAVGIGNRNNDLLNITGTGNFVDDALDEKPNCGTNRWLSNDFTSSNPPRNTTFTCIN